MLQEDQDFLNAVSIISMAYDWTIDEVDLLTRTVRLTCSKQNEVSCAAKIGEFADKMKGDNQYLPMWTVRKHV